MKPFAASADNTAIKNVLNDNPVYIYYFYFTPRCDECIILEKALLKVLNGQYSQELKSKRLIFKMIDLTNPDSESKKIIQELRVRRQLLLLVSGETTVNLTKDAFRYAENQYERFRDLIKTAIDQALTQ
jgi:predicted DsbA family dithiol-disulfide isomerase